MADQTRFAIALLARKGDRAKLISTVVSARDPGGAEDATRAKFARRHPEFKIEGVAVEPIDEPRPPRNNDWIDPQ